MMENENIQNAEDAAKTAEQKKRVEDFIEMLLSLSADDRKRIFSILLDLHQ